MNESRPPSPDTTDRVLRRSTPPIKRLSHRVRLPHAKTRRRRRRERRIKDEFRFKSPGALSLGRSTGRPVGRRRRRRRSSARTESNRLDSTRLERDARRSRRRRLSVVARPVPALGRHVHYYIHFDRLLYNYIRHLYLRSRYSKPWVCTINTVYKHSITLSNINKYIVNRSLHHASIDATLVFDDDALMMTMDDDVVKTPRPTRGAARERLASLASLPRLSRRDLAIARPRASRTPIGFRIGFSLHTFQSSSWARARRRRRRRRRTATTTTTTIGSRVVVSTGRRRFVNRRG